MGSTAPGNQAGGASAIRPPTAASSASAGAPPAKSGFNPSPAPPPGASPEEFEAYRQKCWKEYHEYCAIWQKYYKKNQEGGGQPKGKAPRRVRRLAMRLEKQCFM